MTRENQSTIDWQMALDATGGNRALLGELIELLFEEQPKLMQLLEQSLANSAYRDFRRAAHTLKGCLRYFGNTAAGRTARELELLGETGQLESARPILDRLNHELEPLLVELRAFLAQQGSPPTA
jgi:HPt (histidine-containing phosphotransfer) domain-containing protein